MAKLRKTMTEKRRFARTCCRTNTPFPSKNSKNSIFFRKTPRPVDSRGGGGGGRLWNLYGAGIFFLKHIKLSTV